MAGLHFKKFGLNCFTTDKKQFILRQELWSSGYGWRLMFQRSWVWIPAPYPGWTIFHIFCCKNCNDVCLKRPKINSKRGQGWPINRQYILVKSSRTVILPPTASVLRLSVSLTVSLDRCRVSLCSTNCLTPVRSEGGVNSRRRVTKLSKMFTWIKTSGR